MSELKEWMNPPLAWFAVGLILLLLEFISPGVIILFFGIGAWLVAIICIFINISLNLQLVIFILASVALLATLRQKFKLLFTKDEPPLPPVDEIIEEFIGKRGVVTEKIMPNFTGKIEFRGTYWEAEADEPIAKGTAVEIIAKNNLTLRVKTL